VAHVIDGQLVNVVVHNVNTGSMASDLPLILSALRHAGPNQAGLAIGCLNVLSVGNKAATLQQTIIDECFDVFVENLSRVNLVKDASGALTLLYRFHRTYLPTLLTSRTMAALPSSTATVSAFINER